ncbi:hypothetical protein GCM10027203_82460 [Nonomuraea fastidiosa]
MPTGPKYSQTRVSVTSPRVMVSTYVSISREITGCVTAGLARPSCDHRGTRRYASCDCIRGGTADIPTYVAVVFSYRDDKQAANLPARLGP